jgi:hypothetical protein
MLRSANPTNSAAVTIVLDEAKCLGQPGDGCGKILLLDVRQDGVWRHGVILKHGIFLARTRTHG